MCTPKYFKLLYFIELDNRNSDYQEKLKSKTHSEQKMFSLCWEIDELSTLSKFGRQMLVNTKLLLDMISGDDANLEAANFPRRLSSLKGDMTDFVMRLSKFQRTPATHVFVIMVSSELRNCKLAIRFAHTMPTLLWHERKRYPPHPFEPYT